MTSLQGTQRPVSAACQRLMDYINHESSPNDERLWYDISILHFTADELESAAMHALDKHNQWFTADLRVLWQLLPIPGRVGQNALTAIQDASGNLAGYARDRHLPNVSALVIIPRLCGSRWHLRKTTNELYWMAGRR